MVAPQRLGGDIFILLFISTTTSDEIKIYHA